MEINFTQLAKAHGFATAYVLDAVLATDRPQGVTTLLVMVYPYHSWGDAPLGHAKISTYYYAAHTAYQKAKEMTNSLNSMSESALLCNEVRLKPLLSQLKDFTHGKNTLHYHKQFGSRFHVQTIGLAKSYAVNKDVYMIENQDMCGACEKCIGACPTGALSSNGFDRAKCLRNYMMEGKPVPEEMRSKMGNSLLGCDVCQQVCPHNNKLIDDESSRALYAIGLLINKDQAVLSALKADIGRNMSLPNRVLAQACLIAGNSGNQVYLPQLMLLCRHPSPIVAEHALWSVKKLTSETYETTS